MEIFTPHLRSWIQSFFAHAGKFRWEKTKLWLSSVMCFHNLDINQVTSRAAGGSELGASSWLK